MIPVLQRLTQNHTHRTYENPVTVQGSLSRRSSNSSLASFNATDRYPTLKQARSITLLRDTNNKFLKQSQSTQALDTMFFSNKTTSTAPLPLVQEKKSLAHKASTLLRTPGTSKLRNMSSSLKLKVFPESSSPYPLEEMLATPATSQKSTEKATRSPRTAFLRTALSSSKFKLKGKKSTTGLADASPKSVQSSQNWLPNVFRRNGASSKKSLSESPVLGELIFVMRISV